MNIGAELRQFGSVPFTHGALVPLLADYRRLNDKISEWLSDGSVISFKRGVYVVNPAHTNLAVSLPLVANLLFEPSYVSLDYALRHYGLIPEAVHEITSVTT